MNKCSYVNIKEMSGKGKYYEENLENRCRLCKLC